MSELSPETEELLSRGRAGASLPGERRDAIKGAVLAKLATGAVLTTTSSAAAWTFTTKAIGVAVVAAVVGVGSVGVVKYETHAHPNRESTARTASGAVASSNAGAASTASPVALPPTDPGAPVAAVAPLAMPTVAAVDPLPVATQAGAPAPQAIATTPSSPVPPDSSRLAENSAVSSTSASSGTMSFPSSPNAAAGNAQPPQASSLEDETALLRSAHAALTSGDPVTALHLLDEHARRFPNGTLEPESSADRVFAFCAEKNTSAAQAAASHFLAAHPTGPLATRVRSSCGVK